MHAVIIQWNGIQLIVKFAKYLWSIQTHFMHTYVCSNTHTNMC